jgi:hypothetical protein
MADTKIPSYQVKHVDGVMHLSLPKTEESGNAAEKLRFQPPVADQHEA